MSSYIPEADLVASQQLNEARQAEHTMTNLDFADEVRRDRMETIWRATVTIVSVGIWFFVILSTAEDINIATDILVPAAIIVVASYGSKFLLARGNLSLATWVYAWGIIVSVAYLMFQASDNVQQFLPFLLLIPVYVVGLMLPMRAMPALMTTIIVVIIGVPWLAAGEVGVPSGGGALAIVLAIVTSLISVQVSGELHGIAEWALESYRRERDGATQLFESRQKIEKSFLRQRALTKELESTNEQLDEARSAAEEAKHFRGQFLANMSHELRTPLNAVIGFSETMLNFPPMYNNVELPIEYRQDLEQIHNSGKHLLNIINDILDLSKIDAGRLDINLQSVELEPIIKSSMSTAVGLVGGKPVKLTRETPDDIPMVYGDPVRIRQVLLNLYSNAAKFTEEGFVKLSLTYDDKFVTLALEDTGEGIQPDDLARIFEEFRQASAGRKRARAGSGLGLAISRQLLSLMGGRIWVESTYGKGSAFYFTLPIYEGQDDVALTEEQALSESKIS